MSSGYVLGINSFHADASAALLKGGQLVAAVAEERLNRVKHFAGFPARAVIEVLDRVLFPHSLGVLYTMVCQFIGYDQYGDEGKVMGLAPYGQPGYEDFFDELVQLKPKGRFELNLDYFLHHTEGVDYSFNDEGEPTVAPLFSEAMVKKFGPPRVRRTELTQRDMDLAASLQKCLEKAYFHVLNHLYEQTHTENLCLAGGVALNSVANGLIFERTPFRKIYTQPAAGDDGTALGAAYYIANCFLHKQRPAAMDQAYTGREFSDANIQAALNASPGICAECLADEELY